MVRLFNNHLFLFEMIHMIRFPKDVLWFSILLVTLSACQKKNYSNNSNSEIKTLSKNYDIDRENLIKKDSLLKIDAHIQLNPAEEKAAIKYEALKQSLYAQYKQSHNYPFSYAYYGNKDQIYGSKLYQLIHSMPKGGFLHLHPSAGLDYHWLVEQVTILPNCYVYWDANNKEKLLGEIHFYKKENAPAGFELGSELLKKDPKFKEKLYQLLVFDKKETEPGTDIWKEFEYRFNRINGFVGYQPIYLEVLYNIFSNAVADGISHVELREHLAGSLYSLDHEKGYYNTDSVIHYYQLASERIRKNLLPEFTYSLIYTNIRFLPKETIVEDIKRAYYYQSKYPTIIKGYDLVAEEDAGHTGLYYKEAYILSDSLSKVYHHKLALILHAGESTWEYNKNLYDAALVHTPRVGHGINLVYYPALMEAFRKQNICVEVNPMSNQILGYMPDLRMHPAHILINNGNEIVISSDDPAIFQYTGVSLDYWSAIMAWDISFKMLKKIVENSIDYSLLDTSEKTQAHNYWNKKWNAFVANINSNY